MKARLARLEAGPPALQPKSAMVSLRNQIRDLQRLVDDEAMLLTAASFSPSLGTWVVVGASESSEAQGPAADSQGPATEVAEEPSEPEEAPADKPGSSSAPGAAPRGGSEPEEPTGGETGADGGGHPGHTGGHAGGHAGGHSGGHPGSEEDGDAPAEPSDGGISKETALKIRRELESGHTRKGVPLDHEQVHQRVSKLRRRALTMAARYRAAELARIEELEMRFVGHLAAAANSVKDHVDAALEPLIARAEGRLPPRRPGQTLSQRKVELDQVMIGLRHERSQLVAAEKEEREAKRAAEPPRKRARASKSTAPESGP